MLDIRKNLEGNTELHLDVAIIGVCHRAGTLVLMESHSPEVMDVEAEHNHLERISLLSAGLAPVVEHVAAVVEVTQVGLGGAHRPEILVFAASQCGQEVVYLREILRDFGFPTKGPTRIYI